MHTVNMGLANTLSVSHSNFHNSSYKYPVVFWLIFLRSLGSICFKCVLFTHPLLWGIISCPFLTKLGYKQHRSSHTNRPDSETDLTVMSRKILCHLWFRPRGKEHAVRGKISSLKPIVWGGWEASPKVIRLKYDRCKNSSLTLTTLLEREAFVLT